MPAPEQLSLIPAAAGLDVDERARLRRGLVQIAEGAGSRKATWEALRAANATDVSLRRFYDRVRALGLEGALDELIVPTRADAIAALVASPPVRAPRVAVSTLANQFYCEMQVHLETQHTVRVVSREMAAGAAAHARFEAEAEPISDAEVARRMAAGEALGLVEMPLGARIHGVDLVGRADRVNVQGASARLVLEYKFSGRREVYPSYVAQVQSYGLLLAARGIDTSALVHAVAVLPRGLTPGEELATTLGREALALAASAPWPDSARDAAPAELAPSAPDPLATLALRRGSAEGYGLFVFPHRADVAERNVAWALSYWKGERAPQPTTVAGKCRACPHNAAGLCAVARLPPDGRFEARHVDERAGGRKLVVLTPAR